MGPPTLFTAGAGGHTSGMPIPELEDLRKPHRYPAVSIVAPLQRHLPGNAEDPVRLRDLVDRARRRLLDDAEALDRAEVLERLDAAMTSIDLRNPPDGVGIFAAPGETHVLALPFSVPERLEIDSTFAIRDLVRGYARTLRYRVLVLGDKPARLLEGVSGMLDEVDSDGFPMYVQGARGEPLDSGGYPTHTHLSEEEHRQFFRQVDRALHRHASTAHALPLVVTGVRADLASFAAIASQDLQIIGTLDGNYEDATPRDLASRVLPLVEAHLASERARVSAEFVEAVGAGRGVVGIKAVWEATVAGRGRILLIEDDFVYPARVVDDQLEPAGDADTPGVIDDAVDLLVDMTLDAGGDVMVFGPQELAEHGPVALFLRH